MSMPQVKKIAQMDSGVVVLALAWVPASSNRPCACRAASASSHLSPGKVFEPGAMQSRLNSLFLSRPCWTTRAAHDSGPAVRRDRAQRRRVQSHKRAERKLRCQSPACCFVDVVVCSGFAVGLRRAHRVCAHSAVAVRSAAHAWTRACVLACLAERAASDGSACGLPCCMRKYGGRCALSPFPCFRSFACRFWSLCIDAARGRTAICRSEAAAHAADEQ
jgi:hypothetical protein